MTETGWSFDISTLNNFGRGADAGITAMQQYSRVDYLVRETLQNCYDQKTGDGSTVSVVFSVYRLSSSSREAFLQSSGWYETLRDRIEDVVERSEAPREEREGFRRVLEDVDSGEPLWLLKISDYGTTGLVGGDDEGGKNFKLLCKSEINTPSNRQNRGGNTGIGKSMYWMYSSWRTVFFSSRVPSTAANDIRLTSDVPTCQENEVNPLRIFARTAFPSFRSVDGAEYFGPGFFGRLYESPQHPGHKKALSIWSEDAESLGSSTKLDRDVSDGPGTSILITGLHHPAETDPESGEMGLHSWVNEIKDAAGRWFWPAMANDDVPLSVTVEAYDNDVCVVSDPVEIPHDARPFADIHSRFMSGESALVDAGIIQEELEFRIPARKPDPSDEEYPDGHEATTGAFTLLIGPAEPDSDSGRENQTAYLRGDSGYILDYRGRRIGRSGSGYHAVLLGGTARGDTEEDRRMERFLWRAEPLGHDRWDARRPELRSLYLNGAVTSFNTLERTINARLRRFMEGDPEPLPPGTSRLGRLFRLRGRGGPPPGRPRFNWNISSMVRDGDQWRFSGWATGPEADGVRWQFELSLWQDAVSGNGTYIPVEQLRVSTGTPERITRMTSGQEYEIGWRCQTPSACRRVEFQGTTASEIGEEFLVDIERSRVRIDMRQAVCED